MDMESDPVTRVLKLEQQRGLAYAMTLGDKLIETMKEEVAFRKDELQEEV